MNENINAKWEEICKCMKEFDEAYHKIATYYNLSDSSFWILYDLYNNKEGRTQKELCADWYVSKQTINSSIKYLLHNEYVTLKYEENNKKNKKICITDKGIELATKTIGQVLEIENKAFANIDEKEMDIVIKFFKSQVKAFKDESKKVMMEVFKDE